MRHRLITIGLAAALLAACGDQPRGPLEVQGKTMLLEPRKSLIGLNDNPPVVVEFSDREKGTITNRVTEQVNAFTYTLKDTQLVLQVAAPSGDKTETVEFALDGQRYKGEEITIREMTDKDIQNVAQKVQALKAQEAQEKARKAQEEAKAQALAAKLSPKGAPKDTAAYTVVTDLGDGANQWAAWLYIAHKDRAEKREDDELLRLFSESWNRTKDSFDRQAMRAAELERIQQRLNYVRTVEYVHIPWDEAKSTLNLAIQSSDTGSTYDFEKKAFPLSGTICAYDSQMHSSTGATFQLPKDAAFCLLPVADEAIARQIETARTSRQSVHLRPHGYMKVVAADNGDITLVPVGMEIPVHLGNPYQQRPGELVTHISYWPHH